LYWSLDNSLVIFGALHFTGIGHWMNPAMNVFL